MSSLALPRRPVAPAVCIPRWAGYAGAAAIVIAYFALLGTYPLGEPDEGRYAEIPREMVESGDWLTPRLNYVTYFEKPPLLYWLVAANFVLFGMNEWVARSWLGIFALIGIAAAGALGRAIYGRTTALLAAAVLAATPLYFGIAQFLTLDLVLSTWIAVGLGSFWFAYDRPRRRRLWVLILYVATALGVLTKGPVAVLLMGSTIVLFLWLRRDLGALRWALSPLGTGVFLFVALPWFVLVSVRHPEFARFFLVDQHLMRYLNPTEHQRPLWFYVPILFGGTLPWSAFLLLSPRMAARIAHRLVRRRVTPGTLYLAVWCVVVFAFFSASSSKLGTYILPMLCPLAVLAGRFLERAVAAGCDPVLRRGFVFVTVLGTAAMVGAALMRQVNDDWQVTFVVRHAIPAAAVMAIAGVIALAALHRGARTASLGALWVGMLAAQLIAITGREVDGTYRGLGTTILAQARPDDLVVGYKHYVQAVTFYGRHRVIQVIGRGELELGWDPEDAATTFWSTNAELLDAWASGRRLFLVINRSELEPLRPRLQPPPRQIAAEGKKVLVVNFAPG